MATFKTFFPQKGVQMLGGTSIFQRRLDRANGVAASAQATFDKAATEFEEAARLHREVYDDLQERIDALTNLAADAQKNGMRASKNAQKLREFFA